MRLVILTLATLLCVSFVSFDLPAAPLPPGLGPALDLVSVEFEQAGPTVLVGQNARRQLLVTYMVLLHLLVYLLSSLLSRCRHPAAGAGAAGAG